MSDKEIVLSIEKFPGNFFHLVVTKPDGSRKTQTLRSAQEAEQKARQTIAVLEENGYAVKLMFDINLISLM
jgi:hypothetical protein